MTDSNVKSTWVFIPQNQDGADGLGRQDTPQMSYDITFCLPTKIQHRGSGQSASASRSSASQASLCSQFGYGLSSHLTEYLVSLFTRLGLLSAPVTCTHSVLVHFRPYQLGLASAPTPVHSSLVSAIFSLDLTNGRPRLPFYNLLNIPDRDKLWRRGDTFVNREVWETTWCPLQLGNILLWAWESLVRLLLSFFFKGSFEISVLLLRVFC